MADPIGRRLACAAVVYWETDPNGPRVSRLVVDVTLPPLEDEGAPLPAEPSEAAAALAGWIADHPIPPRAPFGTPRRSEPVVVTTAQWEVAA